MITTMRQISGYSGYLAIIRSSSIPVLTNAHHRLMSSIRQLRLLEAGWHNLRLQYPLVCYGLLFTVYPVIHMHVFMA